ncbi:hypothetical protein ZIOFF_036315 [Zingiber officinale]|uniref:Uncharacterized protein n=1 Tax=Zingiber officinale TaxID=94328 RepID=A0A8J5GBC4_ZINOF|nr:hypothetical protein ZIOFF_036315 [Zingiber officinale]
MTSLVSPKTIFGSFGASPSFGLIPRTCLAVPSRKSAACRCESRSSNNYDRMPQEFREENLKERLKRNYEGSPQSIYGLTPSQMDMFMTDDNPGTRQESISYARSYIGNGGMHSLNAKLYLPKVYKSSGAATDMWIKAKELDANTEYLLELLAKGISKPKEEKRWK